MSRELVVLESGFVAEPIRPNDRDDWVSFLQEPFFMAFTDKEAAEIEAALKDAKHKNFHMDDGRGVRRKEASAMLSRLRQSGVPKGKARRAIEGKENDPRVLFVLFLRRLARHSSGFEVIRETLL